MLRFAEPPDPAYLGILHAALEDLQETLTDLEADDWQALYCVAGHCLSPDLTGATLAQVLRASRAPELYQLTDIHWLLLYDGLRVSCAIHNDYVPEAPTQTLRVGPYQIGPIDLDTVVGEYFWNTDFLLEGPTLTVLGPVGRKSMGVADEVFGIAQGLLPHADELKLTPVLRTRVGGARQEGRGRGAGDPGIPPGRVGRISGATLVE